jgi:hypothetical protein
VAVVGEICVRLNPFANDFLVEKLEERGLRARLAPLSEWLEYADTMITSTGSSISALWSACRRRSQRPNFYTGSGNT